MTRIFEYILDIFKLIFLYFNRNKIWRAKTHKTDNSSQNKTSTDGVLSVIKATDTIAWNESQFRAMLEKHISYCFLLLS